MHHVLIVHNSKWRATRDHNIMPRLCSANIFGSMHSSTQGWLRNFPVTLPFPLSFTFHPCVIFLYKDNPNFLFSAYARHVPSPLPFPSFRYIFARNTMIQTIFSFPPIIHYYFELACEGWVIDLIGPLSLRIYTYSEIDEQLKGLSSKHKNNDLLFFTWSFLYAVGLMVMSASFRGGGYAWNYDVTYVVVILSC